LNSPFYQIDLNYYNFRRFELYLNYSNLFAREKEKEYCANGPLRLMASACHSQRAGCSRADGPIAKTGELAGVGEPAAGWSGNGYRRMPASRGPYLGGLGRKGLAVEAPPWWHGTVEGEHRRWSGKVVGVASSGSREHQGDSVVHEEVASGPEVARDVRSTTGCSHSRGSGVRCRLLRASRWHGSA
jgi:hypothetical protein